VAAPAGQPLEVLVRDELRGPVSEFVRRVVVEVVREELNGAAEAAVSGPENAQEPRPRPGSKPKPAPAELALQSLWRDETGRRVRGAAAGPAAVAGVPSNATTTGALRSPMTRSLTRSGPTRRPDDEQRAA
jgi:hypothetical protein